VIKAIASLIFAATIFTFPAPAFAQASSDQEAAANEIVVVGERGEKIQFTADALRDAAKAFQRHRKSLAPNAQMYLRAERGQVIGRRLWLAERRGAKRTIDLVEDANGRIALPVSQISSGKWELRTSRTGSTLRVRPWIDSGNSSETNRRIGDMRLFCRVMLAFERFPLPLRLLANSVDPCGKDRGPLNIRMAHPIARATVDGVSEPLALSEDRLSYRLSLFDRSISSDALLRVVYR